VGRFIVVFKPKYYPYPLLASFSEDYDSATFSPQVSANKSLDGRDLVFEVSALTYPPAIEEALLNGDADVAVDIDCPGTLFRRVLRLNEGRVTISTADVLGEIVITPLVLAQRAFDFNPSVGEEVDAVFDGAGPFALAAGDPLAIGDGVRFSISHSGKTSNSLLMLVSDENIKTNRFRVDTSSDALQIMVSPAAYQAYGRLMKNPETRPAFVLGVVKDAIFLGLTALLAGDEETFESEWARSMEALIRETEGFQDLLENGAGQELDIERAHEAAQAIVENQGIDRLVETND
jgi:hypothetical protein